MTCIFVYLVFTIIYKWIAWDSLQSGEAPSLLINLIGMFMLKVPTKQDKTWVYGTPDENGNAVAQNVIQKFLIFVAILAIPVMLLAKPYIKYKAHKARQNAGSTQFGGVRVQMSGTDDTTNILEDDELANEHGDGSPGIGGGGDGGAVEDFNLTEALVEQMIHTIEYALGCISHTASYLRLWALSPLSVAILIGMEGLSAFLHALRLHWVEFNSKFYHGEGIEFEPFPFKTILEAGDGAEE